MLSVEKIVIEGFGLHKKEFAFIYTTIRSLTAKDFSNADRTFSAIMAIVKIHFHKYDKIFYTC